MCVYETCYSDIYINEFIIQKCALFNTQESSWKCCSKLETNYYFAICLVSAINRSMFMKWCILWPNILDRQMPSQTCPVLVSRLRTILGNGHDVWAHGLLALDIMSATLPYVILIYYSILLYKDDSKYNYLFHILLIMLFIFWGYLSWE